MESGHGLVRCSAFCRRKKPSNIFLQRKNYKQCQEGNELLQDHIQWGGGRRESEKEFERNQQEAVGHCVVQVKILCGYSRELVSSHRKYPYDENRIDDEFATVFGPAGLLSRLNVFDGGLCTLSTSDRSARLCTVILRSFRRSEEKIPEQHRETAAQDRDRIPTIFVPPCVAANANIFSWSLRSSSQAILRPLTNGTLIRRAKKAFLREVAVPPSLPYLTANMDAASTSPLAAKSYFQMRQSPQANSASVDAARLLTPGCVFASFLCPDHHHETTNRNIRFFQLIHVLLSDDSNNNDNCGPFSSFPRNSDSALLNACIVSPSTELILMSTSALNKRQNNIHSKDGEFSQVLLSPKIPCISSAARFCHSVFGAANKKGTTENDSREKVSTQPTVQEQGRGNFLPLKHPSVDDIVRAIISASQFDTHEEQGALQHIAHNYHKNDFENNAASGNRFPGARIVLIEGREENQVCDFVDAASDIVGMRTLHVNGLASFLFCHRHKNAVGNSDTSKSMITGSNVDKSLGLEAALDIAVASSPCVLHIANWHREISSTGPQQNDPNDASNDEEGRLVFHILETMRRLWTNLSPSSVPSSSSSHPCFNLVVILSSATPFRFGGVANMECASWQKPLIIGPPDLAHARRIWDDDQTFDEFAKDCVLGLSAKAIVRARHDFFKAPNWSSPQLARKRLSSIVRDMGLRSGQTTMVPNVRWDDVGGLHHVRKEIMDVVEIPLKHTHIHWGEGRCGIVLFGPPGTGKTLVAKAVATESGLPFLSVRGPELLGTYVGESEANVRATFESARRAAASSSAGASILFFDELDSLVPRRGGLGDGGGVMDRVVVTFLGELDKGGGGVEGETVDELHLSPTAGHHSRQGAKRSRGVFVIGATNRPDLLDPSLLRPGRFDRLVYLGPAKSRHDRLRILAAQTRKFNFGTAGDSVAVAGKVIDHIHPSLTGADLYSVSAGALMRSLVRLCQEAEAEAVSQSGDDDESKPMDIESVISNWDETRLEPVVTPNDLIEAASNVSPSISPQDLAQYELQREQFCV